MRGERMRSATKSISSGSMLLSCSFSHREVGGLICCWRLQGAWERRGDNYTEKKASLCQDYLCGLLIKSPLKNKNPTAPWLMVPWQRIFLIKLLLTAKNLLPRAGTSHDSTSSLSENGAAAHSKAGCCSTPPPMALLSGSTTSSGSWCVILRLLRLRYF